MVALDFVELDLLQAKIKSAAVIPKAAMSQALIVFIFV
jgi:hypothetical protein